VVGEELQLLGVVEVEAGEHVERHGERRQRCDDADRLDRLLVAAVDEEQREHADERQEDGDRQPDRVVGHCLDRHRFLTR
jgi:hypothetical protein